MPTRVYLVRHGATILSTEDRFAGETDVDLSDTGRAQLRKLADRLSQEPLSAVYASPMRRTLESAGILAAPHGLPVQPVPASGRSRMDGGRRRRGATWRRSGPRSTRAGT